MAIAFARARYIGRSTGGSAVRSAAYNARATIRDERTGEPFSFAHRDAPEHHELLLPEGADAQTFKDAAVLWNAAEAAEKRKDAQVAREIVLALPANKELNHEDRVELARTFAQEHFVSKGLAVQLDVHRPHEGDSEGERANHHAHLLITTRRVEGDRLSTKKARELEPEVKSLGGKPVVTAGELWGETWRAHQDRYFQQQGLEVRVDAVDAVAQPHVGPIRMRVADAEAMAGLEATRRANAAAARDPVQVLAVLTRQNATFSERDLDRHLAKHIEDEAEHLAIKGRVLGHGEVLALHDRASGAAVGRYTTKAVRAQERAALRDAGKVAAERRHGALGERARAAALAGRALRTDQRVAFDHTTGSGGLKLVEGRAGTGKSYTLQAVRTAHEADGYAVVGLAPTNAVAQDLKAEGFARAGTVHAELFALKNGRVQWGPRTLVVVDEASMLDSRVTGELLAEVRRSGAKLVLAGDDRQLASIERGGLFAELKQRHGAATISQVTRQHEGWQRRAAQDLAAGRTAAAVRAFDQHGAITWTSTPDEAKAALVERWKMDTGSGAGGTRFVFAYTNQDVDALNAALRQVRRERGELGEGEHTFATRHGELAFAVGDRVQFTDTLKRSRIYNGNAGTITAIDERTGRLTVVVDGDRREVSWTASELDGFRHGYAGTIHKGQGRTLDHTYLYHSHHWRQRASYVALTRQRQSATVFVATETARDVKELARQLGRSETRAASVAWATREELPPALRPDATARREGQAGRQVSTAAAASLAEPAGAAVPAQGWLIAPRVTDARVDPEALAAVVASDSAVRCEREVLGHYLEGAYRLPQQARARLDALVASHGPTSASQRLIADPGQLGELRGHVGLFASEAARQRRAQAVHVAQAVGPAVRRVGQAEAAAADAYRQGIEARAAADAVGVPRLSVEARLALVAVRTAPDKAGRTAAWQAVQADGKVAGEVVLFLRAVERRFGAEGVRELERSGRYAGARIEPSERGALEEAARAVQAAWQGERAAAGERQRLSLAQAARQGTRLRM